MPETMTRRERVVAALTGRTPDRIPRTYSAVAGFTTDHPGALERIEQRFPMDATHCPWQPPPGTTQGDPFAVGIYLDEWGCAFENVHAGIVGQVKHPKIVDYADLDPFQPPMHLAGWGLEEAAAACAATDAFMLTPLPVQPFERLQFLRGTEPLFRDLVRRPPGFHKLLGRIHEFYLAWIEGWCKTPVDGLFLADDWGTQQSLLIAPKLWREIFKPLYAEYIRMAKSAGKFTYMHSDGQISAILEDLVELGLDAVNAQVTCMDMNLLHERFAGRITFWGQMDRQYMLCFGSSDDARRATHEFYDLLAAPNGSRVVAQMHIEPTARPENIAAVLDEFQKITPGAARRA